jgi:hypothetical protein
VRDPQHGRVRQEATSHGQDVPPAFLPWTVSQEAERRGAVVLPLLPRVIYDVLIVHRDQPLTAAAQAFVTTALASRAPS